MRPADDPGLISFCGLYCGDCPFREGKVAGLARDLKEELARTKFDRAANALAETGGNPAFEGYPEFREVLRVLAGMRCLAPCRSGGGNPRCTIKECTARKGLVGCWECGRFERCRRLRRLERVHGDAVLMNLRTLRDQGIDAFLAGRRHWYSKPRESGE